MQTRRKTKLRLLFLRALGLTLLLGVGLQQANVFGQSHRDSDGARQARVSIVFSSRDRDRIREYFSNRYSNLPPGLAKRNGNLPPGLQRHLERDGALPPGLQKRLTPFPEGLERQLPPLPPVYRRGTIGVDAVILDRRTQRIVDVIYDILRP